eukprot:TRINITY_DN10124_c0_g1_i3.p2 TRINITY_DN10124_c0_g1~~TRINITY_DN10124_c0_g1_i3.p2  ORF type:complete len:100 (-),score=9.25 TRINITY_DN10124_c0_g1_i3:48-347(-)
MAYIRRPQMVLTDAASSLSSSSSPSSSPLSLLSSSSASSSLPLPSSSSSSSSSSSPSLPSLPTSSLWSNGQVDVVVVGKNTLEVPESLPLPFPLRRPLN